MTPGKLLGQVKLSGAKNSALRLLAASLLTEDDVILERFPTSILDAQIHVEMLEALGKKCIVDSSLQKITIKEVDLKDCLKNWNRRSIRNTLLILGCLTTRLGKGCVPLPGGCDLGDRKYDLHQLVLESLGATVWESNGYLFAETKTRLHGTDIHLPIRSTGATENAILCGCLAQGTTIVWNPHVRPEIIDLIDMLKSMGAMIQVYGQERIVIDGVENLHGVHHRVIPDNMEALTWVIGATITGGEVEIIDFPYRALEVPLIFLRESGLAYYCGENKIIVKGSTPFPLDISTGPYPGINSDMQPLMAIFGSCAQGETRIVDLRFPGRYAYANELIKMGIECRIRDNLLIIKGNGGNLRGAKVCAIDLRAGAALMLAGMVAKGETLITDAWQIERGYDLIWEKLEQLNIPHTRIS